MERIGGDVRRELGRFGAQAGMADLVSAWPGAVGEGIARNAWPARFQRDGTLLVNVASSAWGFELAQLAPTIRDRLNEVLETPIKGLKFAPGPLPEVALGGVAEGPKEQVEVRPEHVAAAAELVTSIEDENLREVVAKTAALSLAKAAADRNL